MTHAFLNVRTLPESHMKASMVNSIKKLSYIFIALVTLSCGSDADSSLITYSEYYACEGDIVVVIEHYQSSINATIYRGKEFLMGRSLERDSLSSGELFSTNDLSIKLNKGTIDVIANSKQITGCYVSQSEMKRRGLRDTYYYLSDAGALITTNNIGNDRIQFTLKFGGNVMLDTILPHVHSASGAKYQQGDVMFWVKENTAMMIYQGVLYGHCVVMFEDEVNFEPCTDIELHEGVTSFLKEELMNDLAIIPEPDHKYFAERADLNNDGQDEVFIALTAPYFCGTGGCIWYILNPDFTLMTKVSESDFPIYLSDSLFNGYKELYVRSDGKYHALRFNSEYPSNPSIQPVFDLFSHPEYTTGGTRRVLDWAYIKSCAF